MTTNDPRVDRLEGEVRGVGERVAGLEGEVRQMGERLTSFENMTNARFNSIDARLNSLTNMMVGTWVTTVLAAASIIATILVTR